MWIRIRIGIIFSTDTAYFKKLLQMFTQTVIGFSDQFNVLFEKKYMVNTRNNWILDRVNTAAQSSIIANQLSIYLFV